MAISNVCTGCGGELKYDATSGELKCVQCGSIVDIPEQKTSLQPQQLTPASTIKESKTKYAQYACATCGRSHIVPAENELSTCPSCGDNNLTRNIRVDYMPDGILPFTINKETAKKCFAEWLKKRKFAPNKLIKNVKDENFFGIYYPAYVYNFGCHTTYFGIGITEVSSRYIGSDGQYYTRRDSRREHFSGSRNDEYRNYLDSANTSLSNEILKKIGNYSYENLCVYRPEFLYGWVGTEVHVPLQDSATRVRNNIEYDIRFKAQNSTHYDRIENFSCTTIFTKSLFNYVYLPIWNCNYKFNNKIYNFFVNGTTGKTHGKAPKSKVKITSLVLAILAVFGVGAYFLIKYLISM